MKTLLIALSLLAAGAMIGCSGGGPDPVVEKSRENAGTRMSELYNKAGGDFERLTAEEKAEFLKFFDGNEQNARQSWDFMKAKRQGDSGPTTGRPGG